MVKKQLKYRIGKWLPLGLVLSAGLSLFAPKPSLAADQFDNQVIQFDRDTVVEFEFLESRNAFRSTFGVVNLSNGDRIPLFRELKYSDAPTVEAGKTTDFVGTPGNVVTQSLNQFLFRANTPYALYLESSFRGRPAGIVYSSNSRNPNNSQYARFDSDFSGLGNRGVTIRWSDQGDPSFKNFTVIAGGGLDCPCANKPTDTLGVPNVTDPIEPVQPVKPNKRPRARG